MSHADIRRQLSCGPAGHYDLAQQTGTIVRTPARSTTKPVSLYGMWVVHEGDGYRLATPDEISDMTNGATK